MNSPPLGPKKKSALPSHLLNGASPLHHSVNAKENSTSIASIENANHHPQHFESRSSNWDPQESTEPQSVSDGSDSYERVPHTPIYPHQQALLGGSSARDPRDKASPPIHPTSNRPESPYTLNPPIDFDGLSWPSE